MATVLLFHHALGQTAGFLGFADRLREVGHTVRTPDLYDGRIFDDLDEGVAFADDLGMEEILDRGSRALDEPGDGPVIYAGFSLGALPAQQLAQTRPDARGAVLYHGAVPADTFGDGWPAGVALQVHAMADDPWMEFDVAEALVHEAADSDLFVYPGGGHLFADASLDEYDPAAADLLLGRTVDFLQRVGG